MCDDGMHLNEGTMMKQKIDRLAGAIVLGFHIYCDVILGAVLAVVGAAGFYHSYYNKFGQESRAASPAFLPSRA